MDLTEIFDETSGYILDLVDDNLISEAIASDIIHSLSKALEAQNWDTQDQTELFDNPIIREVLDLQKPDDTD